MTSYTTLILRELGTLRNARGYSCNAGNSNTLSTDCKTPAPIRPIPKTIGHRRIRNRRSPLQCYPRGGCRSGGRVTLARSRGEITIAYSSCPTAEANSLSNAVSGFFPIIANLPSCSSNTAGHPNISHRISTGVRFFLIIASLSRLIQRAGGPSSNFSPSARNRQWDHTQPEI